MFFDGAAAALNQMKLSGKVALVTGTSPNIGGGIAEGLAAEGAALVCVDARAENGADCARYIKSVGGRAIAVTCDVTDERQVIATVAAAREAFGGIDILVNNAAIFNKKGVIEMPLDEWRRQLDIILGGAFLFTKHVAKSMIEQGRKGAIINIISTAGHQGEPNNIAYCTGKSGLLNFTRSAGDGIGRARDSRQQSYADGDRSGGVDGAGSAVGAASSQRRRSTEECFRAFSQRRADAGNCRVPATTAGPRYFWRRTTRA